MSCGLYRLSRGAGTFMFPKVMQKTVQAGLLTRQDTASMHTPLRMQQFESHVEIAEQKPKEEQPRLCGNLPQLRITFFATST